MLVERGGIGRTEPFATVRLPLTATPGALLEATASRVEDGMLVASD